MEENNNEKIEENVTETPVVEEQPTIPPVPETPVTFEPKKENNVVMIVVILLILIGGGFFTWYFGFEGDKVLSGKKEESQEEKQEEKEESQGETKKETEEKPKEEAKEELKEEEPEEPEIIDETAVEVKVDDPIKALFNKYSVGITDVVMDWGSSIECTLLSHKKSVDITKYDEDSNSEFYTFDGRILGMAREELEKYKKTYTSDHEYYGDYVPATDEVRSIIKKYFDIYFGHVIEYDDKYFKTCNPLVLREEVNAFFYDAQWCGSGNYTNKLEYTITKAEKGEKNIYLYVEYKKYGLWEDEDKYETINTKWTFVKQPDGNYYFLRAKPIK